MSRADQDKPVSSESGDLLTIKYCDTKYDEGIAMWLDAFLHLALYEKTGQLKVTAAFFPPFRRGSRASFGPTADQDDVRT